jgi:hypothetical protein
MQTCNHGLSQGLTCINFINLLAERGDGLPQILTVYTGEAESVSILLIDTVKVASWYVAWLRNAYDHGYGHNYIRVVGFPYQAVIFLLLPSFTTPKSLLSSCLFKTKFVTTQWDCSDPLLL